MITVIDYAALLLFLVSECGISQTVCAAVLRIRLEALK